MIRPKTLQPGDRLAVLCGSSPTSKKPEELMQAGPFAVKIGVSRVATHVGFLP